MRFARENLLLYAVTDRSWCGAQTLTEQVLAALYGGITMLQLREKNLAPDVFLQEARLMKALCSAFQIPFIINDNVEVALACQADGIHVGQEDMPVAVVRKMVGPDMVIGVSAETVAEAEAAVAGGADYLGVGAVFPTTTKLDAEPVSKEMLQAICAAVSVPVCAIGGINKDNLLQLQGTGIAGVALVSAIFASKDIKESCRDLKKLAAQACGIMPA